MRALVANWHCLIQHLWFLWRAAPATATVRAVLCVGQAGAAVAVMVCSSRLIEALATSSTSGGDPDMAWGWFAATAAALVVGPACAAAGGGVEEVITARYLGAFQDLLLDSATRPHLVAEVRSPTGAQVLDGAAAAMRHWLFIRGIGGVWGALTARLAGIGALVILLGWRWPVALGLLAGWLWVSHAVARWRSVVFDDTEQRAVPLRHRASYLFGLASTCASAKEVRLFGLADWLIGGFVRLTEQAMRMVATRRGAAVRGAIAPLVALLGVHVAALAIVAADVVGNAVSVGALAMILQAIVAMSAFGQQDDPETSLGRTVAEFARLSEFRTSLGLPFLPPAPAASVKRRASGGPSALAISGLCFAYPQGRPVLEDLALVVEPGECVAVVGPNGAGKSTLLALLGGLWTPDSGTLRVDGLDPSVDPGARARIAPIMQDFTQFPLTAAENITAGNRWIPADGWAASAKAAGAAEVIDGLPRGAGTVLSAEFTYGTELSGGQWQRIALARALHAIDSGAGLLVLDEPAAALDVRAEAALFESVLKLRGRATTILITHRLASVRHADRIVVLDVPPGALGARVVESGTHEDLVARNGAYASMFALQAERFRTVASAQ